MRRWMIWALLAVLWGMQAVFAVLRHIPRQAALMVAIAIFFAIVGRVVYARDSTR